MTKQEVKNNIRYNEGLVRSYLSTIRNLENQIAGYNTQIKQCESKIKDLKAEIQKLETDIAELNLLNNKYKSLQNDFSNRQAKRLKAFILNFTKNFDFKFLLSYIVGMKDLLIGGEYKNAYNGLHTATEVISKKIKLIQKNVDQLTGEVASLNRQIETLYKQINSCRTQIDKTNGDLAYRRRRIRYWESQLQYAT